MNKIIQIQFEKGQYFKAKRTGLKQWNQSQQLEISGLDISDEIVEVHFSFDETKGTAKRMVGTVSDGIIHVDIPAFIMEGPECCYGDYYNAWAWVYLSDEESAETVRKIEFTIETRAKPEDYVHTEDEIKTWIRLENEIKEIKAKADFLAEYGVTTFEELEEAYQNGRSISALKINGENATAYLHADLHAKQNDLFIFNTIVDSMLYQMICDKNSNWTCVEMDLNHPTKVSDFENDAGYVKNTDYATQGDIKTKTNNTRFLASKYIDLIAKEGLANSKLKWTDEEKASARDTIGIVDETFIATYGTTTYEELKEAQDNGRAIFLKMPKIAVSSVIDDNMAIANLVRLENDNKDGITRYIFMFSCDENGVVHYASINWDTKTWNQWDYGYAKAINALQTQMSTDNSNIRTLLSTLLSTAFNSFRGGFRNTAGTLDIKCPGIYLVIGGGTGNKTMTITQNSSTVYEETCNGWFVISSDTGIITPIGIKASLTLAGAFETPGTYQGWTKDRTHVTNISYPAESVIWYLGNANNDVGTW